MKIISQPDFLAIVKKNISSFPFCFLPDYLKINESIKILQLDNFFAPVMISKNKFLNVLQFQFPPVNVGGERLSDTEEKLFSESAVEFITQNKIAHRIAQPKNYSLFSSTPSKGKFCEFGTYKINLQKNNETELLEKMQARYRTAVRQVEKLNFEIKFGISELKNFQALHHETMKRTNAYAEEYEALKEELTALPQNTILATIYMDGVLQGGLFIMFSKFSAYYFHGASADTTQAAGAIKFLHYKIMCLLKEKGVMYYDFVGARLSDVTGTKLEGIQNFKRRFGSELEKGYLWKLDIDKTKCKAYDSLLKVKCKLKGTKFPVDIIDQEKNKKVIL